MTSLAAEGLGRGSFWESAVGKSPQEVIAIAGVEVQALVDSGSMVTLVKESFHQEYLSKKKLGQVSASSFRLTAANGLDIPIQGYAVLDVKVRDQLLSDVVIIIMKDQHWSLSTPCLLGMNILQCLPWWTSQFPTQPETRPPPTIRRCARTTATSVVVPATTH